MKTNHKKAEGRGADHINGASLGDVPRLGANKGIDMKQREIRQEGGMSIEKGHMKPRWGTKFEIITDNPYIDNGIYECRRRTNTKGFGPALGCTEIDSYEYKMVMLTWYKPDGTKVDVSSKGASAYIGETELRKARRI